MTQPQVVDVVVVVRSAGTLGDDVLKRRTVRETEFSVAHIASDPRHHQRLGTPREFLPPNPLPVTAGMMRVINPANLVWLHRFQNCSDTAHSKNVSKLADGSTT